MFFLSFYLDKKTYYFIFEQSQTKLEYDYLVMELTKGNSTGELFVNDMAYKLNDYRDNLLLTCIVSDEMSLFLVMISQTPYEYEDDLDDEDINELYM